MLKKGVSQSMANFFSFTSAIFAQKKNESEMRNESETCLASKNNQRRFRKFWTAALRRKCMWCAVQGAGQFRSLIYHCCARFEGLRIEAVSMSHWNNGRGARVSCTSTVRSIVYKHWLCSKSGYNCIRISSLERFARGIYPLHSLIVLIVSL